MPAIAAELGTITVDHAHIADGAITSAKIADTIQNAPFEPGRRGWRIERDGRDEFNDVVMYGPFPDGKDFLAWYR